MAAITSLSTTLSARNPSSKIPSSSGVCSQKWRLQVSRRELLSGSAGGLALVLSRPSMAREEEVGGYLPPFSSDPSFVLFTATYKYTPALRAGNVEPYKFILPPTWKQLRVANILSGNYCQPKCAEPWVEFKFEDENQGKVQVVASPLVRLTNKPKATIEDIGTPGKSHCFSWSIRHWEFF